MSEGTRLKTRLLIGHDGSPCADAALAGLARAGLPPDAEALVLTAADILLPTQGMPEAPDATSPLSVKSRKQAEAAVAEADRLAALAGGRLKAAFPGWTVQHESCADSPAWALIKKADAWKPTLLVLGAHGHSVVGRFVGSVSQMVLAHASCSVRIGRAETHARKDAVRVLLAIDGSADSEAALTAAASRAWPTGTEFLLLTVIDPKMSSMMVLWTPSVARWFIDKADDEHTVAGRMLESLAKPLRDTGAAVTCLVKEGDPKHVLVTEAENWGADCLFLGARGLTGFKRFLMGGVSTAVAARAHCSVEVVRP